MDDLTFCEVCHQSNREDRMLLCDGCDCGYHLECLTPPLNEVPIEEWFCPECSQNREINAEVVSYYIHIYIYIFYIIIYIIYYINNSYINKYE